MNKVILTGNLCQDVELKLTPAGKEVVTNCIAVKRDYKNSKGEYETDFINIRVWNAAKYLQKYARKGDRVELVGCWEVRKYTAADGSTQTANECKVETIKVFSRQKQENKTEDAPEWQELPDNEDLPF